MNCSNCNSPSPDGKKYCAECGTLFDPAAANVEKIVETTITRILATKFADQKLVEIETSQAIVERLHGWAKLFGFFLGVPLALFVILIGMLGVEKYSDLRKVIDGVEQQVKPKVEQANASAEKAQVVADEAQKKALTAESTSDAVVKQINQQLGSANKVTNDVRKLSERMSQLETKTSTQIRSTASTVDSRVAELNQKMDLASKNISDQEKKLASTDELVKALFSKGVTEVFQTSQPAANILILPLPKPSQGALVWMLLRSVPILQTTEIKCRFAMQPRGSYSNTRNALFFYWGDPSEGLKQCPLEVTYVPDPTEKGHEFKTLILRDHAVYADDVRLAELQESK